MFVKGGNLRYTTIYTQEQSETQLHTGRVPETLQRSFGAHPVSA